MNESTRNYVWLMKYVWSISADTGDASTCNLQIVQYVNSATGSEGATGIEKRQWWAATVEYRTCGIEMQKIRIPLFLR